MFRRPSSRRRLLVGLLATNFLVVSVVFVSLVSRDGPPPHVAAHPYFLYDLDASEPKSVPGQACILPRVHPFHPSVWEHFAASRSLTCKTRGGDLTFVDRDGVLRFNQSAVQESRYDVRYLHCSWSTVRRDGENDDKVVYGETFPLRENGSRLPATDEFIQVKCINFAGLSVYEQLHARVQHSSKPHAPAPKNPFNVLIFGLDSMSRLAFIRLLPRTYRYLTENLNLTVFRGMNKVGDNTYPNLIALLTGKKAYGGGLPSDSEGFDNWPLIWKNYSSAGYVTMWAEDFPEFGLFNYLAKGFRRPPTDHYLRPFWLAVEESTLLKFSSHMCYGSVPKHMLQINYVKEFISSYHASKTPYFGFSFLAEISHDYISRVASADEHFEDFFTFLDNGGYLENTVLIVMSDHGHRFDAIRSTEVGHIEERMPFFALHIPPSISKAHPDIYDILSANTARLTTPYDTYATLEDLLQYFAENRTLGQSTPPDGCLGRSLFGPLPLERSCGNASVPAHFCTCESEAAIPNSDLRVSAAAEAAVRHVNELVRDAGFEGACAFLTLKSVRSARLVRGEEDSTETPGDRIRVVVEVNPSDAIFEATTMVEETRTHVLMDVSRINPYGEQSKCIKHVILRKYCYCTNSSTIEGTKVSL